MSANILIRDLTLAPCKDKVKNRTEPKESAELDKD